MILACLIRFFEWLADIPRYRKFAKGILRSLTRKSELERICITFKTRKYYKTFINTVKSLKLSKDATLRNSLCVSEGANPALVAEGIIQSKFQSKKIDGYVKLIDEDALLEFLTKIIMDVIKYNSLAKRFNERCNTMYDKSNKDHTQLLGIVWTSIYPEKSVPPVPSKEWTKLGFQGKDPFTDFRSLGVLAPEALSNFCRKKFMGSGECDFPDSFKVASGFSPSNQSDFCEIPFAITFFNIIAMVQEFLVSGELMKYFATLNFAEQFLDLEHLYDLIAAVFLKFCDFWVQHKPKDLLSFNILKDDFAKIITQQLPTENFTVRNS